MRLQLSIHRHALPAVHILFTTGIGPTSLTTSPTSTIADFLRDVQTLVPLESGDGSWGLEDYVVQLQATADQEKWYECLHYQEIGAVFRDDDEVVIRSLSSEEIRERRLGGRFQVRGDGRHLIDGVGWGRRWLGVGVGGGRPEVSIPPRKRRRLEIEAVAGEQGRESEQALLLAREHEGQDEYSEEDDEDYAVEKEDEDDENEDSEDDEPKQIAALAEFDNADPVDHALESPEELQALLDEAADFEQLEGHTTPPRHKRKRAAEDEGDENDFEGFSTPAKSLMSPHDTGDWTSDSDSGSDSGSDSDSKNFSDSSDGSSDETSSSGTSSDSESDEDTTSDSDLDSLSETSSSDSSSHSFSDDEALKKTQVAASGQPAPETVNQLITQTSTVTATQAKLQQSAPGQGLRRTQANNARNSRKRRLKSLKASGVLPENANFKDMEALDHGERDETHRIAAVEEEQDVEEKRRGLLEQLRGDEETVGDVPMDDASTKVQAPPEILVEDSREDRDANLPAESGATDSFPSPVADGIADPPQRRARLDTASSRRMIFGSLGLKTPKTPAAEQELREKLAATVKRTPKQTQSDGPAENTAVDNTDAWKDKINLLAVECEQDGVKLSEPPFPFRQGWDNASDKRQKKSKKNARNARRYYADGHAEYGGAAEQEVEYAADLSTLHGMMQAATEASHVTDESRTLSLEKPDEEDMPRSNNIDDLPVLSSSDVNTGAVIAFKEYEMVRHQPEISSYRIARILEATGSGYDREVKLILSKRDWRKQPERRYDPVSGNRMYSLTDIIGEEEGPDDGIRVFTFTELVSPKLVEASSVYVPASGQPDGASKSSSPLMLDSAVIPESGPFDVADKAADQPVPRVLTIKAVEITTPRRHEITTMIKDTGFDSALDNRLLQPLADPQSHSRRKRTPTMHSPAREVNSSSPVSAGDTHGAAIEQARSDNHHFTGWSSSPVAQQESDLVEATPEGSVSRYDVNYPQVSQLHLDSSIVSGANSSSHQDAQRVPDVVDVDTSHLHSHYDDDDDKENDEEDFHTEDVTRLNDEPDHNIPPFDSLKSDVPASQDTPREAAPPSQNSFLGGLDGHVSSDPDFQDDEADDDDDDDDDDDSTGLPNLRDLTTSQLQKITRHSRTSHISPPAVKRNLRSRTTRKTDSPAVLKDESEDLASASEAPDVQIEISQSQRRQTSQIPASTQVVDLNITGSPMSASGREINLTKGRKRGGRRFDKASQRASSSITSSMASGLGNRRLLTNRRSRSEI